MQKNADKFEVSSIIVTSFRRVILPPPPPQNEPLKRPPRSGLSLTFLTSISTPFQLISSPIIYLHEVINSSMHLHKASIYLLESPCVITYGHPFTK